MDEPTRVLIALGASAALNCRPCLEHHLRAARELRCSEDDILLTLDTGLGVAAAAVAKTREHLPALIEQDDLQECETACALPTAT